MRQAYDYVLSEDSPAYYQEFIQMFPHDPAVRPCPHRCSDICCRRRRGTRRCWRTPRSPTRTSTTTIGDSPYAQSALKLQAQPKALPLMQPTHLIVPQDLEPTLKFTGQSKYNLNGRSGGAFGQVHGNPGGALGNSPTKIVTLPAPTNARPNGGNPGRSARPAGESAGKIQSTQELKGDRGPGRIVDHHPSVDHHPEQLQRQSRFDAGNSRIDARNSDSASSTPARRTSATANRASCPAGWVAAWEWEAAWGTAWVWAAASAAAWAAALVRTSRWVAAAAVWLQALIASAARSIWRAEQSCSARFVFSSSGHQLGVQIRIDIAAGEHDDDVLASRVDPAGQQRGKADRTARLDHELQFAEGKGRPRRRLPRPRR